MELEHPIRIGIDATNIGGGGGITHLKEIIEAYDSDFFKGKISSIVIFGSSKTLNNLCEINTFEKQTFSLLNKGVPQRIVYQIRDFDNNIESCKIDVLLSLTGDYVGSFKPVIAMSRNMLLYEREIWREIKSAKEILRFWLNFQKQKRCFKNATGIIFISEYAKKTISSKLNLKGKKICIIHHGISQKFIKNAREQKSILSYSFSKPFRLLYVSTVHVYKHQWNVVKAISVLRKKGYPVALDLVGGVIFKRAGDLLENTISQADPRKEFINYHGDVEYSIIHEFYNKSDGLIFASTCENMPNILLESMASGLPIACSDKQPMPEFLKENGFYFDSYNVGSIIVALEKMLLDESTRNVMIKNNLIEINKYSWKDTSKKTFLNVIQNYKQNKNV
ncbi:glycosyltransferase family 4 protein [Flagellimonas sp. 389]|uniref:glycosyltransferase family 4 protein n=1 Tax=Flagellimonas sp. 389 TaxID=2835862 RepID=UPI001BD5A509|nr:glycosyltransferase family 1 protein [Flagellimonas sp. 389]MBS9461265.1 glycosyltransferase family 4 protein [Flagellimonas sp. 389]